MNRFFLALLLPPCTCGARIKQSLGADADFLRKDEASNSEGCAEGPLEKVVDVAELEAFQHNGGLFDVLNQVPNVLGNLGIFLEAARMNRTGYATRHRKRPRKRRKSSGGHAPPAGHPKKVAGPSSVHSHEHSEHGVGSPCKGHLQQVRVPYRCHPGNTMDCDLGGCAKGYKDTGKVMVRAQPVGPMFLFANQAWGGVHVTVADFGKYTDPVGMFEKVRRSLGPEYKVDWRPKKAKIIHKQCKKAKLKFTRIDFQSSYLQDIGQKLKSAGFNPKIKQPHISIERGGAYEPIRQEITQGVGISWNLALVKIVGKQVVTLATLPLKRKSSQT